MKTIYMTDTVDGQKVQTVVGTMDERFVHVTLAALRTKYHPFGDKAPTFHAE